MREIEAVSLGTTVVVSFRWSLDQDSSSTYVVPLEVPDWDPVTASDHLITRLDLPLSSEAWKEHAHPIGAHVAVVVVPPLQPR